jgi:hypothetical protein
VCPLTSSPSGLTTLSRLRRNLVDILLLRVLERLRLPSIGYGRDLRRLAPSQELGKLRASASCPSVVDVVRSRPSRNFAQNLPKFSRSLSQISSSEPLAD